MNTLLKTLCFISAIALGSSAQALTSNCGQFFIGTTPVMFHDVTYSAGDVAFVGEFISSPPYLGMSSFVRSPFFLEITNNGVASPTGGAETTEEAVTSAGTWIFDGVTSIGAHNPPYFDVVLPPLWCFPPVIVEANPPTGVFVSIVPAVVTEGESVTISWGSQDADECLFEGTPIGTSGSVQFAAALSDGRTYAIDCFNMWGSTPASAVLTVNALEPQITILSADIISDAIVVQLEPTTATGILTISLAGEVNHMILSASQIGGIRTFSFEIPDIPENEFTQVEASWTVGGVQVTDTEAQHFRKLGTYYHSQYNSPAESQCAGSPSLAYITNSQCNFSSNTLISGFINAVNLNGSGRSINFNDVAPEQFCMASAPQGAMGISFRRDHIITGAFGNVSNNTVAVNPFHPYLSGNDTVFITGIGVKTVTDICPGCSITQLDNYTTNTACLGVPSLGNFTTIKMF